MELEPSFYRLHVRLIDVYTRKFSFSARRSIERILLALSICLLGLLVHLHTSFVGSSTCLDVRLHNHGKPGGYSAQVVHVTVSGTVSNLLREIASGKLREHERFNSDHYPSGVHTRPDVLRGLAATADLRTREWIMELADGMDDVYEYSRHRAFLLMSTEQRLKHKVDVMFVTIPTNDECMGSMATRLMLEYVIGYEALLLSAFQARYNGMGYVADLQLKHLYALNMHGRGSIDHDAAYRIDVVSAALFLFFATTAIIDVVLRETHMRMLHFAVMLGQYLEAGTSAWKSVAITVARVLTYIVILSGVAYLMGEFLGDQVVCWALLIVNWGVQLATIVSARMGPTLKYLPQLYAMVQLSLYIYILRYPFAYTYVATLTAVTTMLYIFAFFLHRFEIPGLQHGLVNIRMQRAHPVAHVVHVIEQVLEQPPGPLHRRNRLAQDTPAPELDS